MRLTVAEGTPDEIRQLFPHLAEAQVEVQLPRPNGSLPDDVQEVLGLARPADRDAVYSFMAEVAGWGGVQFVAGHRQAGGLAAYVRFHRRGGDVAAFAYLFPGRMYVRPHLPAAELAGARYGTTRGGNAANGDWSRNLALSPQEAWDEALGFTKRAFDAAGE